MKTLKIYNTLRALDWGERKVDIRKYISEITNAVNADDIDLAEYADEYHGETYSKKLITIRMSTEFYNGKLYGLAICKVNDDWTENDTEQLKDYLSGQYSDGWGESFEQREIRAADNKEIYVSFWQWDDFQILTEEELKQSMKKEYKVVTVKIKKHFADKIERFVKAESFNDILLALDDDEYILEIFETAPPNERGWLYRAIERTTIQREEYWKQ